MSKKLVVVADDYGFLPSVNRGVERAYNEGIVTEISLMVNSVATQDIVDSLKAQALLHIGLPYGTDWRAATRPPRTHIRLS